MTAASPITLLELNSRLSAAIAAAPGLRDVWVCAETSDVRVAGGHCYLELIQKDPDTGAQLARARATIWRSAYGRLAAGFRAVTGCDFASGIKVLVRVAVSYHPVYGLSLNIDAIDPEYTLGDLLRRRREMIARLTAEGIIDCNRSLGWPARPWRVAVISAAGAAGYGDFVHQLIDNPRRLRFSVELFAAVMQGDGAPASIVAALEAVAARQEQFDCVVLIRGGGATGDLACFDDYTLAANIALFPLPVIIGIGHERDVTLLDYVANLRVKTPTAAAEWLCGRVGAALDHVAALGADIMRVAAERISRAALRLEGARAELPHLTRAIITAAARRCGPEAVESLRLRVETHLARRRDSLDAAARLIDALSPQATLRRGFSITRRDGHALTDPAAIRTGDVIETTLAEGIITSIAK